MAGGDTAALLGGRGGGSLPEWAELRRRRRRSAVVVARVLLALGSWSIVPMVVLTGIVSIAVMYPWSRAVEGKRQAKNRLMTLLIAFAFSLALLPLLSLLYEVFSRGLHAFSADFFTDLGPRRDRRRGRRRARDPRDADHHRDRHRDLGADRAHGGDLPQRVRRGEQAAQGAHLLRRRDDRDPLDRRRAVRLRAVRALPRARDPARDHGLDRAHGADDPDRDPLRRGDPEDRPQPPARGRVRARDAEVEDDRPHRPADRARRPGHRRDDRRRPRSSARPHRCWSRPESSTRST